MLEERKTWRNHNLIQHFEPAGSVGPDEAETLLNLSRLKGLAWQS